ncbi:hypothetical protein Lalb_Chr01g0017171 [Lupinus albus]|uniref:Uncharacterized protein n=1 Tax=Lupinus albus TaxID=3870 RepID=A0A6A4R442_LUPAL|nr:hypothetical protein Lalb_Chr01g0017171 [Lupinus albus]
MDKSNIMLVFLVVLLIGNVVHGQTYPYGVLTCDDNDDCGNCNCPIHCRDQSTVCRNGLCKCGCGYCLKKGEDIISGEIIPCRDESDCVNCTCPLYCRDKSIVCRRGQCKCGCGYCLKN